MVSLVVVLTMRMSESRNTGASLDSVCTNASVSENLIREDPIKFINHSRWTIERIMRYEPEECDLDSLDLSSLQRKVSKIRVGCNKLESHSTIVEELIEERQGDSYPEKAELDKLHRDLETSIT